MPSDRLIPLGPHVPRRGNTFSRLVGLLLLRWIGWRVTGDFPNEPKAVLIVAPHTSNYDGLVVVSALLALGMRVSFFVKHTAFRWPVAGLMRWFGALPVNRESSQDLVGFSASKFSEKNELLLAMAPEGTRDSSPAFKSGFYWIARQAGVPVIVIGFDYGRREVRILKTLAPSGDPERDLPDILACYRGITPRHPERLSLPLRELDRTAPD